MSWDIDVAIFLGFLLINLIVGLFYGRGVKTISDYALGGRNFSTAALVATIVATFTTGSSFFVDLSNTYSDGIVYLIPSLAISIQLLLLGIFVAPRMVEFMGCLSIAEVMGNMYGKEVRLITAISGILASIGIIAVQFKVFGNLVNYFVGVSQNWGIIIAATIVILYSAFGGIKAITYTDVLQFFTFGFAIPLVGIIIWNEFQTLNFNVTNAVHHPLFNYQRLFDLRGKELFSFICLIIYFTFPTVAPTDFQRISMGRNIAQVQRATIISTILFLIILLAVAWIPFLLRSMNPDIEPSGITAYIINHYTHTGLKGILIIGVAAMAMSSADSFINGCAVLFAYDFKEVLNIKTNNLILSKLFSIVLGGFAVYLAISTNDLLSMIMATSSLYMPIVSVPLIISIFGFRSTGKSVLISMVAGFATVVFLTIFGADEVIIPAMVVNALALFGSHYLTNQPGGWVGIKDTSYIDEIRSERKRKIVSLIYKFKNLNFIDFCKKTAPKDEMMYTWLGIYFIFFTISTMYSTQVAMLRENGRVILIIYQIMMCTGVLTAMYPIWPSKIKREIIMQVSWNIIIFYMLVFFSCFFVMLSNFGQLQFSIFTMNMIITALLVGWKLSFPMIGIGAYLSVAFYKYYVGLDQLNITLGSPQFIFMYTLMLVGSALIIFLKPKQEREAFIEDKNEHLTCRLEVQEEQMQAALAVRGEFIRNVTHEYNTPMTGIVSLVQSLHYSYRDLNDKQRIGALQLIMQSAKQLENFDNNISALSKLSKSGYILQKKLLLLNDIIYKQVKVCRRFYEENQGDREFKIIAEEPVIIEADENYLTQAIDNLIINAIIYCKKGKIIIELTVDREQSEAYFSISDEGIGIPPEELYDIFSEFTVGSRTKTPAGGRGVGLTLCKRVIEAHGGSLKAESNGIIGAKFSFIIPTNYSHVLEQ